MPFIYIVGIAGTGKTTIHRELLKQGIDAYDEDGDGVGSAHNKKSNKPVLVPEADERTPEWFEQHEWKLLDSALKNMQQKAKDHTVVLCGNSLIEQDIWKIFDKVIYLELDEPTLRYRIANREGNDYGKNDFELQTILKRYEDMNSRFLDSPAIKVDASQPIEKVVSDIIALST